MDVTTYHITYHTLNHRRRSQIDSRSRDINYISRALTCHILLTYIIEFELHQIYNTVVLAQVMSRRQAGNKRSPASIMIQFIAMCVTG